MRSSRSFHRPTAGTFLVAVAAGAVLLPLAGPSSAAPPVSNLQITRATAVQVSSDVLAPSMTSAVTQGAPVTLIAAVTPATAAGTVQFMDGMTAVGDPVTVTNGAALATTSTSALAVGSHALTAVFTPADKVYGPSTSPALSLTVTASEDGGSLQASSQAQPSGQSLDQVTPSSLQDGPLGIPGVMLDAYQRAEREMAVIQPGCNLSWTTLAGIGQIESDHASGGRVDAAGNTLGPILGPQLNGTLDVAAISDTDGGTLDTDPGWDRAVGPMQFIPSTWRAYGAGSPNNIYNATLAAGRYLCAGGTDLSDPAQQAAAIYRYNHSAAYVNNVLRWTQGYLTGVIPTPSKQGPVQAADGTLTFLATGAPQVRTVAQRTPQVVAQLDSPAVAQLDPPPVAQLDAQPASAPAPAPSPTSLD
ncbi:MAG: Ig-like domain repeat protein [Pseudonocardiaceae bacterium]